MHDVVLPDLCIPFPARLNPFEAQAAEHTTRWARAQGFIAEEAAATRFTGESYARLVSRLYPEATQEDLTLAADLNSWFHLFDDQFELAEVGRDAALARRLADQAGRLLLGGSLPASAGPVLRGLADLRDRMRARASADWWERFSRDLRRCFIASIWEVENRIAGRIPDPEAYVEHKLEIAYVPPSFDLIELTQHFEPPPEIRLSPEYGTLLHEAGHVVVCTNDIIGLRRELTQGEFHNLVIVLREHEGCSLQEAIDRVEQTIDTRLARFLDAKAALEDRFIRLGSTGFVQEGTRRCVTGMQDWMRGYLDWARETRRFADPVLRGQVTSFHHELAD